MKKKQEQEVMYKEVEWEDWSDNAIRFNLIVCYRPGVEVIKKVFAPKSMLKGDSLPYWFIRKKYQEIVTPDMTGWKVKGDYKRYDQGKLDL